MFKKLSVTILNTCRAFEKAVYFTKMFWNAIYLRVNGFLMKRFKTAFC